MRNILTRELRWFIVTPYGTFGEDKLQQLTDCVSKGQFKGRFKDVKLKRTYLAIEEYKEEEIKKHYKRSKRK